MYNLKKIMMIYRRKPYMKDKSTLIKEEIESLPEELQDKVLKLIRFVKKEFLNNKTKNNNDNIFDRIMEISVETNITDLAENHDYYIYGDNK
jgi:beta-galactosidase beta subunit